MRNCIDNIFPGAELLREDAAEAHYMIPAGADRFWLAVPADRDLNTLHFVFVFSGRGGTGCSNNISGDGIHLSPEGHKLFAEALFKVLEPILIRNGHDTNGRD